MVALCINQETPIKGMIVPIFRASDGSGREWKGEPLPPACLLRLRAGLADCSKSHFDRFEITNTKGDTTK